MPSCDKVSMRMIAALLYKRSRLFSNYQKLSGKGHLQLINRLYFFPEIRIKSQYKEFGGKKSLDRLISVAYPHT